MAEFGMYAVGGSEETAMESAVLVNAYRPFQLWVRRVIVSGGTWDPFSGSSGAQYFLADEGQRLHVTIIPTPLKVGGPETVEPGQPAQFTADIVGPFQFRRQTPWGDTIHWQYYPGDTLPEPNAYLGGIYLYECTNQPTCSYTPKRNGRMGVNAQVQYNVIGVRSAVVRIDSTRNSARLQLSCGPTTVLRGDSIACTAAKDPANAPGELTVTGWSFNGVARSDGDPASLEWKGVMVRSGTVQVTGRIGNGPEESASATVEVMDRAWPDVPTMHLLELGATGGEDRVRPLPEKISWASDLGYFRAFPEPPPGEPLEDPITYVQGGPNDGLYYFADLSFPIWGRIRINDVAMSRGSAFYEAQERNTTAGGTRIGGQPWCSNRVVTSVLPGLVRDHEQKHADVYRQQYAAVVRAALPELERMTGTYTELADRYEPLREEADQAAVAASWAIHNQRGNPNRVTPSENGRECNLKNEDGNLLENPSQPEGESQ
jgi:hypothetical protein